LTYDSVTTFDIFVTDLVSFKHLLAFYWASKPRLRYRKSELPRARR
jgi:hypothetical protein